MQQDQAQPLPLGAKSPQTAFILDFFFPGVGHLYASGGEQGAGLLIANILVAATIPFVYVTALISFVIWGYAWTTARDVALEYNKKVAAQSRAGADQLKEIERLRAVQDTQARLIRGLELAEEVRKLASLRKMNVISDVELATQKRQLIDQLRTRQTTESVADFFLPLGPLLDSGDIVDADIAELKLIHAMISPH